MVQSAVTASVLALSRTVAKRNAEYPTATLHRCLSGSPLLLTGRKHPKLAHQSGKVVIVHVARDQGSILIEDCCPAQRKFLTGFVDARIDSAKDPLHLPMSTLDPA